MTGNPESLIASAQAPTEKGRLGLTLTQIATPWTGDLDGMVERRMVRVHQHVWFNNVERIASERIGRETVTYVSNIYKYYVTYLLIQGEYIQRGISSGRLLAEARAFTDTAHGFTSFCFVRFVAFVSFVSKPSAVE